MTVSPAIELAPGTHQLRAKLAQAVVALVAFALLSGVWLAYFMFVPLDFRIR